MPRCGAYARTSDQGAGSPGRLWARAPRALSCRSGAARPRPGISGQARPDLVLIRSPDQVQGLLAVADRSAQDDKAVTNGPVHELGVFVPGLLTPDLAQQIPLRAVNQPHREMGYTRSLPTADRCIPVMPPAGPPRQPGRPVMPVIARGFAHAGGSNAAEPRTAPRPLVNYSPPARVAALRRSTAQGWPAHICSTVPAQWQ